jgi:hypothetical protein
MQTFVSVLEEIMTCILGSAGTKFFRNEVNFSDRLQNLAAQKIAVFIIIAVRLV